MEGGLKPPSCSHVVQCTVMVTKTLDLNNITISPNQILANEELWKMESQMARYIQESMLLVLKPVFPSMNRMLADLNKSLMKSLSLTLSPQGYPLPSITGLPITKTEVIPIPETPIRTRSRLGLSVVAGNIVAYKRALLKGITSRNIEGRYLILLLSKYNLLLTDVETRAEFLMPDGQPYYWILSKLRKKFEKVGLKIDLERVWYPDGYILAGVTSLN